MVNKYKRKTLQAAWEETTMKKALGEVRELHNSVKSTAKKYGIPRSTLQRHLQSGSAKKKLGRYTTVFTPEEEKELIEYVFHMDALFYGLSKKEFLELVYQYADMNGIPHQFKNGTAGSDWYKGFVVRHPDLTLRKPEPTSIARARGFNRPQVYRFFDLLEAEIEKHDIDATRLYNMDETGIQTSSNKPPRVLTKVGKRQVGLIASTERGRTTTVVCCCNAAGSFVPPFLIFARKKMNSRLLDGAPPCAQGTCSDNGWINGPVFLEWLRFFVETVRPTPEKKVILVMDNHESHKFLPALEYASKNNVIFVSLAPHTTHKMQPLDICVYGPLKVYFEQAIATFQKAHAGRIINQNDIAQLFAGAYMKAASTQNAVNGFKSSGLLPTNRHIFDEADFLPATITENPITAAESNDQQPGSPSPSDVDLDRTPSPSVIEQMIHTHNSLDSPPDNMNWTNVHTSVTAEMIYSAPATPTIETRPETPVMSSLLMCDTITGAVTPDRPYLTTANTEMLVTPCASNRTTNTAMITDIQIEPSTSGSHHSPMMIRPLPKVAPNKTARKRKTQRAEVLTSTPIKDQQRGKMAQKRKKEENKVKAAKKKLEGNLSKQKKEKSKQNKTKNKENEQSNCICIICNEPYVDPPTEDWIRCDDCHLWAHDACTSYTGIGAYYCDNCQEI